MGEGAVRGWSPAEAELRSACWSSGTGAGTCVSEVAGGRGRGQSSLRDKDQQLHKINQEINQ